MLNHPKASLLLQAMFSGMNGGGGMPGGLFEDDEMDTEPRSESEPTPAPKAETKPAEAKPDPKANLTPEQREAEKEKELGNEAYKKKDFETALKHYEKAAEVDPTNITYLTNKAGMSRYLIIGVLNVSLIVYLTFIEIIIL